MTAGVKFSQFTVGGSAIAGDQVVGLRGGVNTIFNINAASSSIQITQAVHGFAVGNILRLNGATYVLAKADNATDANVVGIVSSIIDANTFELQLGGYVIALAGLVAGSVYFLDPGVAGGMTTVEPVAVGQIRKPVFIAATTTTGFWLNYNGQQL